MSIKGVQYTFVCGGLQQLWAGLRSRGGRNPAQLLKYDFDRGDAFQIFSVRTGKLWEHVDLTDYPIAMARSDVFKKWVRPVLAEIDDKSFCVHLGDSPCDILAEGIPNLCYCKRRTDQRDLRLIPDAYYQGNRGYNGSRRYRKLYNLRWEDKEARLVFRGAYTGEKPLENNMRAKLCSIQNPVIDARLTGVNNAWEEEEIASLLGEKLSRVEMARYKYQIDIDGNSSSWDGLFWKMMSGGLVFKLSSEWEQWYYPDLIDGFHYVSVKNYDDLMEKLLYYIDHDSDARQIAENARSFTSGFDFGAQYKVFLEAIA